ncbi:MAG: FliM/FliN family flagellar motor switch protein [Planctomycetes bacterium]|nr:FliM/FliN family flagellar motor switch protein [Planctomycetota bacterium]
MSSLGDILNPGTSVTTINPAIVEAGAKIAAVAMEAGFNSWGTSFQREILFRAGDSNYLPPAEYLAALKEPLVVTAVKWGGDRSGHFFIGVPESAAKGAVACFMAVAMGNAPDFANTQLDADGMDAYSELVNSLVQQGAQKARGEIGGKIEWVVESNSIAQPGAGLAEALGKDELVCCSGTLTVEGLAPATVYMMMDVPCTGMSAELPEERPAAEPQPGAPSGHGDLSSRAHAIYHHRNEALALKLSMPINVTLAVTKKRVESVQELAPGSIIEFRKQAGEFLDVNVGNTKIAEGEAVIVNQHFGIQIRRIVPKIPFASMLR